MEAVENDADRGMIHLLHDRPGVAMVEHVPAPGKRFIADDNPALGRPLSKLAQIRDDAVALAQRMGRTVGADQDAIGAQFAHQVELGFGAIHRLLPHRAGHPLEISKGLVEQAGKTQIVHHRAHRALAERRGDQVVFEYLDPVETRRGGRAQLFLQRAAERNRCDAQCHARLLDHGFSAARKFRLIRCGSAARPVKCSNARTAWYTVMPLPSSVAQPASRASCSNCVSSGK